MTRLAIVVLCAGLIGPAMAADAGTQTAPKAAVAQAQPANTELPPGAESPAGTESQPASEVQSAVPAPADQQAAPATPKSAIPLEKRKGGDVTQCLEAGSKSDKDIAACAEKYRR